LEFKFHVFLIRSRSDTPLVMTGNSIPWIGNNTDLSFKESF